MRLTVVNVAKETTHNFTFTPDTGPAAIESSISLLAPGQEETIEFDVAAPGDYPFECSFHVQLGQGRHDDGAGLTGCPSSTWC